MKIIKLLSIILVIGGSSLVAMNRGPEPIGIRKLCYHGEYPTPLSPSDPDYEWFLNNQYIPEWRKVERIFQQAHWADLDQPIQEIHQPESLVNLSVKAVAQKIDNNEIALDQAKKSIPVDLHPQLEAEVNRLQKLNPKVAMRTPTNRGPEPVKIIKRGDGSTMILGGESRQAFLLRTAERVKRGEISLDRAKMLIPNYLHGELEAEVQRLQSIASKL